MVKPCGQSTIVSDFESTPAILEPFREMARESTPLESSISLGRMRFVLGQVAHSKVPVGLEPEMIPMHVRLLVSHILMDPSSPPDTTRVLSKVIATASIPWGWPFRIP